MYRRRPGPFINPLTLVLFGVIAGIAFLIYDNAAPWTTPTMIPTVDSTILPATTGEPFVDIGDIVVAAVSTEVGTQTVVTQLPASGQRTEGPLIMIPAAGVHTRVIQVFLDGESWDVTNLGNNVGHLQGTPWFDDPGNIVLSGHVELTDGRRGVFASLKDLKDRDLIIVEYNGVQRRYVVNEIRNVPPDDLSPLMPSDRDQLTLITCDAYDFWSDSYLERTVIIAERAS
jgi:LPXTG-site transpeptidase (sortase) family protein